METNLIVHLQNGNAFIYKNVVQISCNYFGNGAENDEWNILTIVQKENGELHKSVYKMSEILMFSTLKR